MPSSSRRSAGRSTAEPEIALEPLEARMHRLADDERFEEAAATRDRLSALARAIERRRTVAMWRGIERLVVECDGRRVEIRRGRVRWPDDETLDGTAGDGRPVDDIAEILVVDRWIARHADTVRVAHVTGELASQLPRVDVRVFVR